MISNTAMADSAHEYPVVIPRGTRSYRLRLREPAALLLAEVEGGTLAGASYITIDAGNELSMNLRQIIEAGGETLWLRAPDGQGTAELFCW